MSIPEFSLTRIVSSVGRVEYNAVIIPPAPLIVPELGGERGESVLVRAACRRALAHVCKVAVGKQSAGSAAELVVAVVFVADEAEHTLQTGSLSAWGSGIEVGGGNYLPELLARWLVRDVAERDFPSLPMRISTFGEFSVAVSIGADVIMVMADGPSGLTEDSPHALVSGAAAADAWCSHIAGCAEPVPLRLATSEANDTRRKVAAVTGWRALPLWGQLAEGTCGLAIEKLGFYGGAPFGVGYHVAAFTGGEVPAK